MDQNPQDNVVVFTFSMEDFGPCNESKNKVTGPH